MAERQNVRPSKRALVPFYGRTFGWFHSEFTKRQSERPSNRLRLTDALCSYVLLAELDVMFRTLVTLTPTRF